MELTMLSKSGYGKSFTIRLHPGLFSEQDLILLETNIEILNKQKTEKMKKANTASTMTKKARKATKTSAAAYGCIYVCDNVSRLNNGMYRARKYVNGMRMSRNFTLLREAKAWLTSLA